MNKLSIKVLFLHYILKYYSYDTSNIKNNRAEWQRRHVFYLLRCKLRLYCLRISDQILILGNGGVKLSRTYQEDKKLSGYVMDLQTFDEVLIKAQKNGTITIEKNMITDIESATFEI